MRKKKKEKPKEQSGKEKLFKNPIKSMETTLFKAEDPAILPFYKEDNQSQ